MLFSAWRSMWSFYFSSAACNQNNEKTSHQQLRDYIELIVKIKFEWQAGHIASTSKKERTIVIFTSACFCA